MHFIFINQFKTEPEYLKNIGEVIRVDFPKNITIVTMDLTGGDQTSSDNNYYKYRSVVRFNDNNEIKIFEDSLNETYWINGFSSNALEFIPMTFVYETMNYDKFLLYCYEYDEYNRETNVSNNNYVCIAYSRENKCLIIYEFMAMYYSV